MSGTTNVPGVCIVIRDGSKILMLRREHTGWKDGEYCIPSGHVEDNETFRQAAVREVMEEVGLTVSEDDLQHLLTVQRVGSDSIRLDTYFEALKWSGTPTNTEPDKHGDVSWHEITELPANVVDYIHAGLESIDRGESYAEFNWPA